MSTSRRLSQLLLVSHVGLVLLFAVLLLATGVGTIRSAVVAQARSEAERVGSDARRQLQAWNRELSVGADLLAQQPTLRFYLQRRQLTKARTLVRNFHKTSDIEYVRVQLAGKTIAEFGVAPPSFNTGLAFDPKGVAWRVLQREVRSLPQASIVIAEKLGDRLDVRPTTSLINAELLPIPAPATGKEDAWTRVLRQVSSTGEPVTFGAIGDVAAARVIRIRDEAGGASALLSAPSTRNGWSDGSSSGLPPSASLGW